MLVEDLSVSRVGNKIILCPYCGKDTMRVGQFTRVYKAKRRVKKFCNNRCCDRYYRIMHIKNIEKCRKGVTDYEKELWYKCKKGIV